MRDRGRPRMNGLQPPWMLGRTISVLQAFNEARENGDKYEAAILAAIKAVKAQHPEMRIGPRRVKEILAAWQPKDSTRALTVCKRPDAELQSPEMQRSLEMFRSLGLPAGKKVAVYTIGVGPRPEYPRINSRQRGNTPACGQ